jgi:hypothetical protein
MLRYNTAWTGPLNCGWLVIQRYVQMIECYGTTPPGLDRSTVARDTALCSDDRMLRYNTAWTGPLNLWLVTKKLHVIQRYVVRADFSDERKPFSPFPGKAEVEGRSSLENLRVA